MKNIFIWGTGNLLKSTESLLLADNNILGYIDNDVNKQGKTLKNCPILMPKEVLNKEYDAIIVATTFAEEIQEQCIEIGIDLNKVIFPINPCLVKSRNSNFQLILDVFGEENAKLINAKHKVLEHILSGNLKVSLLSPYEEPENYIHRNFKIMETQQIDTVRVKTLELVAKEVNNENLQGEVAELGVYKGNFARHINRLFPNKKMYLFDTFEGFEKSEVEKEINDGNWRENWQKYNDTSLSIVLSGMENIDNIIIKKGLFPDSLNGLEEKFCFVSLDVDFEKSTYEGLKYFYPRLVQGGYIFIHDYNYSITTGIDVLHSVRKAIQKYENEQNIKLCKVPINDYAGTLIITKQ